MGTPEQVREMIQKVLEAAPLSIDSLAKEAGVSRGTLYLWMNGKRNPTSENLAALANALERRGGELQELAEQLRQATELEGEA